MKTQIEQVRNFMALAGQHVPIQPSIPMVDVIILREKLHHEEACLELAEAFNENNITKILDSVCDSLVVIFGTALSCGFTAEQVEAGFNEVMRSNMSKFIDGHRRADGKWVKGPSYSPANLEQFIK